jgi:hypothetical protein
MLYKFFTSRKQHIDNPLEPGRAEPVGRIEKSQFQDVHDKNSIKPIAEKTSG